MPRCAHVWTVTQKGVTACKSVNCDTTRCHCVNIYDLWHGKVSLREHLWNMTSPGWYHTHINHILAVALLSFYPIYLNIPIYIYFITLGHGSLTFDWFCFIFAFIFFVFCLHLSQQLAFNYIWLRYFLQTLWQSESKTDWGESRMQSRRVNQTFCHQNSLFWNKC